MSTSLEGPASSYKHFNTATNNLHASLVEVPHMQQPSVQDLVWARAAAIV